MNIIHDIDASRITPEDFVAVVEIEKYGCNKYEVDKETGLLMLDRVLYTSTHYPANYGCIPLTLAGDGDPIDVFVYCSQPIQPMSLVRCYPIGAIDMMDSEKVDTKIIAVPFSDPTYNSYKDVNELPKHIVSELIHFLTVYKQLENKTTVISNFYPSEYAKSAIADAIAKYKEAKND